MTNNILIVVLVLLSVVVLAVGVALVYYINSIEKFKRKSSGCMDYIKAAHISGLPLGEGAECEIYLYPTHFVIKRNKTAYKLPMGKLKDVAVKTETEIQTSYVSSVGGAVGGAAIFGAVGAMVGGRAKKKTDTKTDKYLIFSYDKNGDGKLKYISFLSHYGADKFEKYFAENHQKKETIVL